MEVGAGFEQFRSRVDRWVDQPQPPSGPYVVLGQGHLSRVPHSLCPDKLFLPRKVVLKECDQIAALFFNIWAFPSMKFCPNVSKICQYIGGRATSATKRMTLFVQNKVQPTPQQTQQDVRDVKQGSDPVWPDWAICCTLDILKAFVNH